MQNPLNMKGQDLKDVVYIGTVVDGNDPDKQGRCRIRVPHVFDGVDDTDLPWARADRMSGPAGNVNGSATCMIPANGSKVYVAFQLGDPHDPIYTTDILNTAFFSGTVFGSEYPYAWGFSDGQNFIKINRQTGDFKLQNATGSFAQIAADGTINASATKDINATAPAGTATVSAQNIVANASQAISATATTTASVTVGTASITIAPGSIIMDNGTGATVKAIGPNVLLN